MEKSGASPVTTVPGVLAVAMWSLYVLLAVFFYWPDYPPSALTLGACGILAAAAVVLNFPRWRPVVALASGVYLAFYAVRVGRMIALTADFDMSSLLPALFFYYVSSLSVTAAMVQERGFAASLAHGYIEYAMPVLSLALIVLALVSRRRARAS